MLLTFLVVATATAVLLLGFTLFLQGYLYQQPADQLPWRAIACGVVLAGYLTVWTFVNTRADSPNKYGTFFEFNPTAIREIQEFDAIRLYPGLPPESRERTVSYRRGPTHTFLDVDEKKPFRLNDSSYFTIGMLIPEGKEGSKKTRFDAELKDGKVYATDQRIFRETNGSRYLEGEAPWLIYSPSSGAVLAALLLNAGVFLVWFVIFWPGLKFGFGHAVGLALAFGLVVIVLLMPLLFRLNTPKPATPTPAPAAMLNGAMVAPGDGMSSTGDIRGRHPGDRPDPRPRLLS